MAIEKEIIIKADTSQAEAATEQLADNLKDVDKEADKAASSIEGVADNGGAIAILDQLTGGLATSLKDAYEASKLFNFSLKATRGALIATGIGAFVVALGAVVVFWEDIVELIDDTNAKLAKQNEEIGKVIDNLDTELKILDEKQKILELEGKSTEEVRKQKEAIILIQQEQNQLLLDNLATQLKREQAQVREITLWEKIKAGVTAATQGSIAATDAITKAVTGNEEQIQFLEDLQKQLQDSRLRAEQLRLALLELNKPDDSQTEETFETPQVESIDSQITREDEFDVDTDPEVIFEQEKADRLAEIQAGLLKKQLEAARQRLLQEEVINDTRVTLEENTFALLANIAEKGSALSKTVAIANVVREQVSAVSGIISNTGIANAKAVAASPLTVGQPFVSINTISAALGIAGSIAGAVSAIKDITSEKKTPTGGAVSFGSGGGPSAPSFNLVEGSGTNQIAQSLQQQDQPVRAYVVSSDVSTGQSLDRNIQGDASL